MRRILCLMLLALLLTGCGASRDAQPTIPIETDPPVRFLESTDGAVSTYRADSECVKLLPMGDNHILFTASGRVHLLSGDDLTEVKSFDTGCPLSADDPGIFVSDGKIAYFNTSRGAYVILDHSLTEIASLTIREELSGQPVISPDFSTVYYCTADGVRAVDVATGAARLLRQEHGTILELNGLLFDGSVLRYTRSTDGREGESCFIRTADGTQVYLAGLKGQVCSWQDRFGAMMTLELPMGSSRYILTGAAGGQIRMLNLAQEDYDTVLFPGEGFLLTQKLTDGGLTLGVFDLNTGCGTAALELPGREAAFGFAQISGEALWLWDQGQARFLRWDMAQSQSPTENLLTDMPSLTGEDSPGLEQVLLRAEELSGQYGIPIRFAQSGNRTDGVDYSGYPDFRPDQYAQALDRLAAVLARFPGDFFAQLRDNYPVAIELVDDYDPAMEGYKGTGELTLEKERVIRVSICPEVEAIFFHQLFHAVELFSYKETNRLESWTGCNPEDFEYGGTYGAFVAGELDDSPYLTGEEQAFADAYCLVSAREDRAQTFMYAMLEGEEARFAAEAMQEKLLCLSEAIRGTFSGYQKSEEVFPWERYLQTPEE